MLEQFNFESTKRLSKEEMKTLADEVFEKEFSHLVSEDGEINMEDLKLDLFWLHIVEKRHANLLYGVTRGRLSKPGTYTAWALKDVEDYAKEDVKHTIEDLESNIEEEALTYEIIKEFFGIKE